MERSGNMERQDQDWGPQTGNMNTERRGREDMWLSEELFSEGSAHYPNLKTEAAGPFETFIMLYQTAWHHIPESSWTSYHWSNTFLQLERQMPFHSMETAGSSKSFRKILHLMNNKCICGYGFYSDHDNC